MCLAALIIGWTCCFAYGQCKTDLSHTYIAVCLLKCRINSSDIELVQAGVLTPGTTVFYTVTCNVNIPSPEGEVQILFDAFVTTTNNAGDIVVSPSSLPLQLIQVPTPAGLKWMRSQSFL